MTITSRSPWPLLFLVLLIACVRVDAIYENQAGLKDWYVDNCAAGYRFCTSSYFPLAIGRHHKWIGRPQTSFFYENRDQTQLLVATERNVIASLNTTFGDILWRHVLNEPIQALVVKGNNLLSISGNTTRLWRASTGFLIWESAAAGNIGATAFGDNGDVFTLTSNKIVQRLARKTGAEVWTATLDSPASFSKLAITTTGELYAVGVASPAVHVIALDSATGAIAGTYQSRAVNGGVDDVVVLDGYLVCVDGEGLSVNKLGKAGMVNVELKSFYSSTTSLKDVGSSAERARLVALGPASVWANSFVLEHAGAAALFRVGGDGRPVLVADLGKKEHSIFATVAGQSDSPIIARVEKDGDKSLNVHLYSTSQNLATYKIDHDFSLSGDVHSATFTVPSKDGSAILLFLTTMDGSVRLITKDGVGWSREEALADTVDVEFLDLPERHLYTQDHDELDENLELSETIDPVSRYIRRLVTHISELKYLPAWTLARLNNAIGSTGSTTTLTVLEAQSSLLSLPATPEIIYRDTLGLRKLVISATLGGKVVAQDTGAKGKIVWARYFDGVRFEDVVIVRASMVKFPPLVVAVGRAFDAAGHQTTVLYRLNALTGQDFIADPALSAKFPATIVYPFGVKKVFKLPFEEPDERTHPLVVVDETTERFHLYPSTAETSRLLAEFAPNLYFKLDALESGSLKGYRVVVPENGAEKGLDPELLWKIGFPNNEQVVAFGEKNAYEKIASLGRVLGNRNVLYKYLNPHLLAVATYAQDRATLGIYLIDLVKGSILYHAKHEFVGDPRGVHPVHVAQVENWVVYTFWSEGDGAKNSARGQQVVTLELFESGFENDRVVR
ncbi:hypothetical protein BC937DRAFT_93709 [Endogone sp. FLAS-F59071]|nr:hypothetical protein BC937DRAFT_93709 [Endogone sp. FLAS-F59071]|eukprot:RUS14506.1 hypothetical protein BC937DRAFT_93709 [Endogone sp. FLAS-F59071]